MTLMTVMTTKTTMMTMMMSTHCIDRRTYVDPVLNYWAAKPDENWKAFDDTDDECAGDGFDLSKASTPPTNDNFNGGHDDDCVADKGIMMMNST